MKKLISFVSALVLCVSLCSCGKDDDKNKEIKVPILEATQESYNTVTADVGSITMSYTVEGQYSYPYSRYVSVNKGGVVEKLHFDPSDELKAGQLLIEFECDEFKEGIEAQELRVSEAEDNYEKLKNNGASKAVLDVAQVDLDIEKNNLDKLNKQLDVYKVYAPIDGYIEMDGLIEEFEEGKTVEDGKYIGRIIDRGQKVLTATTYNNLDNVGYGTKVNIKQGAVAEATGFVSDMVYHSRGEFSTYEYIIEVDDDTEFFDFGTITVNFSVYEKDEVVIVPTNAIVNVGKRTFVYTIVDGIRIETDVEVGIIDELKGMIEITSGLNGGETIVVA